MSIFSNDPDPSDPNVPIDAPGTPTKLGLFVRNLPQLAQGFAIGASTPNQAHGGGADAMAAFMAPAQYQLQRRMAMYRLMEEAAQTRHNNSMSDYYDGAKTDAINAKAKQDAINAEEKGRHNLVTEDQGDQKIDNSADIAANKEKGLNARSGNNNNLKALLGGYTPDTPPAAPAPPSAPPPPAAEPAPPPPDAPPAFFNGPAGQVAAGAPEGPPPPVPPPPTTPPAPPPPVSATIPPAPNPPMYRPTPMGQLPIKVQAQINAMNAKAAAVTNSPYNIHYQVDNDNNLQIIATDKKSLKTQTINTGVKARSPKAPMELTPEAEEYMSQIIQNGGDVATMGLGGMGSANARIQVVNKAAADANANGIAPGDMVANRAAQKANSAALVKTQNNADAVQQYVRLAKNNVDLLVGAASKIPDAGAPWINQPLRAVNLNLLGSADQAAANAAFAVANREIANVLHNPNLTGQLTDDARHAVDAINSPDATFGQIVASTNLLKKEMDNRVATSQEQLNVIKKRISHPAAGGGHPATVNMKAPGPNGKVQAVPADQVEHYKAQGATVVP